MKVLKVTTGSNAKKQVYMVNCPAAGCFMNAFCALAIFQQKCMQGRLNLRTNQGPIILAVPIQVQIDLAEIVRAD